MGNAYARRAYGPYTTSYSAGRIGTSIWYSWTARFGYCDESGWEPEY